MGVTRAVGIVEDARFREHRGPTGHPERPERLLAVAEAIAPRRPALVALSPRPATEEEILRVHARPHLDRVVEASGQAPVYLDPDTYLCPASLAVAELAAGGTTDLARAVARGALGSGLAAVRPPGHHAEESRAMGFCLFNNVAIAARALQAEEGVDRILILDWDVHHGNGTQRSFEDDRSVLYFSTHQFPYYPGTGDAHEVGIGAGRGATVNVPMPAGCGDREYIGAFQRLLVPVARAFRPEILLVSCGFDAHRADPLAAMEVSAAGFQALSRIVRRLADELCGGRVVLVLEGGYSATGLREGVSAVLDTLLEPEPALPDLAELPAGSLLRHVVDRVAAAQRPYFPGIGAP
jgi:acetoin utilization deacetylase AcuC-like enzyme